ncbi:MULTISPECIES: DUF3040 domain-containing protein [unclassified Streptomyces]|uniref:DUF3040 domain-containing protein n=1 Tax=unclassified Streptomyces TaxID=2593676 RepID=UPI000DB964C9|nr:MULTISPECIES: DUF3040 domain-containing protein [unclassified Streptomyces]MYU08027.1 DUF3040 domain-containing protein [Streptomyces sp. SID8366]MYU68078.1 DUF3040 domain-containing protein [Streptomyces sp. SID69]RAJ59220.1 hypothetical protein K376_02981 [Streptomyces sp. PsTaAH-130]
MDDWEMWDRREKTRLSPREQLKLLEIEAHLREDRGFARRMGGGSHRERGDRPHRRIWLPAGVLLLALASAFCAVMGIRTWDPWLLWSFAALWPLTLFQALRLLCRLARRRGRVGERAGSRL